MFNPKNDVLPKKHFLIIFFSVLSILFFIVVAEQNKKTLHYLNLEALIATVANNKEFFLVFAVII